MPLNTKIPQQIVSSTTTALSVKRGDAAMLVADLDKGTIVLMDGKTYGGIPMAREDAQIRAGSDAITVNDKEWAPLLGNINIDINPEGFIENVVSPTDKVLGVGVDGKIAAQLSVSYDETSGLFSLKGKDGETISSFTLVIPTGITPKSVALVENPEGQEPGLYLEFVFIDDDDVEIKLYADMDILKDVYTAGRGITISDDRVISVDEDAISGVIADDLIEENSGLKVVNDKLHLDDHASETPEYGLGDAGHYGHVRLADSGDGTATVQAGIAATPAAVKDVDDRAVHNEGDETISGVKTFVDTPKINLPGGGTDDVATITDVQMLVDGTIWNKRVDSIPEDTDVITADMPVGGLVVSEAGVGLSQVIEQNDHKVLANVPGFGIATTAVAGVVQPDGVTTKVDLVGVLSALGGNLRLNSEAWITESGDWEAPVAGWYSILAVDGGGGGRTNAARTNATGGASGAYKFATVYLEAGQSLSITIGAAGKGVVADTGSSSLTMGGITTVEGVDFSRWEHCRLAGTITNRLSSNAPDAHSNGAGFGGSALGTTEALWYGAGGGAIVSAANSTAAYAQDGFQGVVVFRWHDPAKAAGPEE